MVYFAHTRYTGSDEESNMAIVKVRLVSGYYPDKESLRLLQKQHDPLQRYEVDNKDIYFYFSEVSFTSSLFSTQTANWVFPMAKYASIPLTTSLFLNERKMLADVIQQSTPGIQFLFDHQQNKNT